MRAKRLLVVAAFLAAATLAAAAATGPDQNPTFRVRTDLVRVDVLVTNRERPVAGLSASDFEIRDNGVVQKIDGIQMEGLNLQPVPLSVLLVFDTSESLAGQKLQLLAQAGTAVLGRLRPVDQAGLITFSERAVIRHALSPDLASVRQTVLDMTASGRTALFDGLYAALNVPGPPDARKMILVFSDGADNTSWLSAAKLQAVVRQSDAVLYAVGLDASVREQLGSLAEETGGAVVVADSPRHLQALFVRLLAEMQSRYLLTYYPSGVKREGWHALDVRMKRGKGEVRARKGYFVSPG